MKNEHKKSTQICVLGANRYSYIISLKISQNCETDIFTIFFVFFLLINPEAF